MKTTTTRRTPKPLLPVLALLAVLGLALPAFAADYDADGLDDAFENAIGTDYQDADSDDDGWDDFREIFVEGTDPTLADSDGDSEEDDVDAYPLIAGGDSSGGTPSYTVGSTLTRARSGESPYDGVNVCLVNGDLELTLTQAVGRSAAPVQRVLGLHYSAQAQNDGLVGNWSSILDTWIQEAGGSGDVTLLGFDGRTEFWEKVGGDYVPPTGCLDTLVKDGGVFIRTSPSGVKVTYGSIDKIEDRYGNTLDFTYATGKPVSVTDPDGKTHSFNYYGNGRLETLVLDDDDAGSATWTFKYNLEGQLWRIEGPETASFPSGIAYEFRYINGSGVSALNGNLVAASDGKGQWWLRNEYDTSDRVVKQRLGGSTTKWFEFAYDTPSSYHATVTDRAGNDRVWQWDSSKLTKTQLTEETNRGVRGGEGDYVTAWTHDGAGYLLTVTYPLGNGVKYTLNAVKQPTEVRRKALMSAGDGEDDLVDEYEYDSGKYYGMTSHTDPEGHETTYTLDAKGRPTTITYPEVGEEDAVEVSRTYDSGTGLLTSTTDGEGKVTTYEYYDSGPRLHRLWKKIVDDGGLELTTVWDYEDWGDVKSVTDPNGNTTTYTVERYGNVEEIQGPVALGYVTQFDYDLNLNVIQKRVKNVDWDGEALTSPSWWTTSWTYTTLDKVNSMDEQIGEASGRGTLYEYDDNDNVSHVTWAGHDTYLVYDERDLVYTKTYAVAGTDPVEEFTYDDNRNLTVYTNPRGYETTHVYDGYDRRVRTVDALDHSTEFVHDKHGHVVERKSWKAAGDAGFGDDVLVAHHKSHYDEMDRLWKEEDALLGESTTWYDRTFTFDGRSLVTSAKDRRNETTDFTYDGAGRRLSQTDPVGNVTDWEYDDNGNVTAVEDTEVVPVAETTVTSRTEFTYDAINRRITQKVIDSTNGSNFKLTQFKHGAIGLRKTIDPLGNEVVFALDGLGRVLHKSEDLGSSQSVDTYWTYRQDDRIESLTDDNGHETVYEYDNLGRLTLKTYEAANGNENGATVVYEYDLNGNVSEMTDQNGSVFAHGYDALDRLTDRAIDVGPGVGGGDATESFEYDALGRLLEAQDDDTTVQLTYDSLSRILTEVQGANPLSTEAKTVTYQWDAESNRTFVGYPSGFEAHEHRDALGRIDQIEDDSEVQVAAFHHIGAGLRPEKIVLPNGGYQTNAYDGFRRPTAIVHKDSGNDQFAGFAYAWDKNDNPLMEKRWHKSGKGDVYSYDKVNRLTRVLTEVDDPEAEIAEPDTETYVAKLQYNMDGVFNLTSYVRTPYGDDPVTTSYTTDAMNQYTDIGAADLTYTDAGSLEDDGTRTYTYDAHQHLIAVHEGETPIATYAYDALGLGRRTSKTVSGTTTRYVYAGMQSVEEYEDGDLARLFVFGERIDQVVMMEAPDHADVDGDLNTSEVLRFSYHGQLLGSVTHVTGPDGSVVEQYEYDPYGAPTLLDGAGDPLGASAIKNPYLYTGRQLDEETGLYYYRARHYSPEMRRFIERDPLEYVDGPNAIAYAQGSPSKFKDPTGLAVTQVILPDGTMITVIYDSSKERVVFDEKGRPHVVPKEDSPPPARTPPPTVDAGGGSTSPPPPPPPPPSGGPRPPGAPAPGSTAGGAPPPTPSAPAPPAPRPPDPTPKPPTCPPGTPPCVPNCHWPDGTSHPGDAGTHRPAKGEKKDPTKDEKAPDSPAPGGTPKSDDSIVRWLAEEAAKEAAREAARRAAEEALRRMLEEWRKRRQGPGGFTPPRRR